jgi:hypothetical protein
MVYKYGLCCDTIRNSSRERSLEFIIESVHFIKVDNYVGFHELFILCSPPAHSLISKSPSAGAVVNQLDRRSYMSGTNNGGTGGGAENMGSWLSLIRRRIYLIGRMELQIAREGARRSNLCCVRGSKALRPQNRVRIASHQGHHYVGA